MDIFNTFDHYDGQQQQLNAAINTGDIFHPQQQQQQQQQTMMGVNTSPILQSSVITSDAFLQQTLPSTQMYNHSDQSIEYLNTSPYQQHSPNQTFMSPYGNNQQHSPNQIFNSPYNGQQPQQQQASFIVPQTPNVVAGTNQFWNSSPFNGCNMNYQQPQMMWQQHTPPQQPTQQYQMLHQQVPYTNDNSNNSSYIVQQQQQPHIPIVERQQNVHTINALPVSSPTTNVADCSTLSSTQPHSTSTDVQKDSLIDQLKSLIRSKGENPARFQDLFKEPTDLNRGVKSLYENAPPTPMAPKKPRSRKNISIRKPRPIVIASDSDDNTSDVELIDVTPIVPVIVDDNDTRTLAATKKRNHNSNSSSSNSSSDESSDSSSSSSGNSSSENSDNDDSPQPIVDILPQQQQPSDTISPPFTPLSLGGMEENLINVAASTILDNDSASSDDITKDQMVESLLSDLLTCDEYASADDLFSDTESGAQSNPILDDIPMDIDFSITPSSPLPSPPPAAPAAQASVVEARASIIDMVDMNLDDLLDQLSPAAKVVDNTNNDNNTVALNEPNNDINIDANATNTFSKRQKQKKLNSNTTLPPKVSSFCGKQPRYQLVPDTDDTDQTSINFKISTTYPTTVVVDSINCPSPQLVLERIDVEPETDTQSVPIKRPRDTVLPSDEDVPEPVAVKRRRVSAQLDSTSNEQCTTRRVYNTRNNCESENTVVDEPTFTDVTPFLDNRFNMLYKRICDINSNAVPHNEPLSDEQFVTSSETELFGQYCTNEQIDQLVQKQKQYFDNNRVTTRSMTCKNNKNTNAHDIQFEPYNEFANESRCVPLDPVRPVSYRSALIEYMGNRVIAFAPLTVVSLNLKTSIQLTPEFMHSRLTQIHHTKKAQNVKKSALTSGFDRVAFDNVPNSDASSQPAFTYQRVYQSIELISLNELVEKHMPNVDLSKIFVQNYCLGAALGDFSKKCSMTNVFVSSQPDQPNNRYVLVKGAIPMFMRNIAIHWIELAYKHMIKSRSTFLCIDGILEMMLFHLWTEMSTDDYLVTNSRLSKNIMLLIFKALRLLCLESIKKLIDADIDMATLSLLLDEDFYMDDHFDDDLLDKVLLDKSNFRRYTNVNEIKVRKYLTIDPDQDDGDDDDNNSDDDGDDIKKSSGVCDSSSSKPAPQRSRQRKPDQSLNIFGEELSKQFQLDGTGKFKAQVAQWFKIQKSKTVTSTTSGAEINRLMNLVRQCSYFRNKILQVDKFKANGRKRLTVSGDLKYFIRRNFKDLVDTLKQLNNKTTAQRYINCLHIFMKDVNVTHYMCQHTVVNVRLRAINSHGRLVDLYQMYCDNSAVFNLEQNDQQLANMHAFNFFRHDIMKLLDFWGIFKNVEEVPSDLAPIFNHFMRRVVNCLAGYISSRQLLKTSSTLYGYQFNNLFKILGNSITDNQTMRFINMDLNPNKIKSFTTHVIGQAMTNVLINVEKLYATRVDFSSVVTTFTLLAQKMLISALSPLIFLNPEHRDEYLSKDKISSSISKAFDNYFNLPVFNSIKEPYLWQIFENDKPFQSTMYKDSDDEALTDVETLLRNEITGDTTSQSSDDDDDDDEIESRKKKFTKKRSTPPLSITTLLEDDTFADNLYEYSDIESDTELKRELLELKLEESQFKSVSQSMYRRKYELERQLKIASYKIDQKKLEAQNIVIMKRAKLGGTCMSKEVYNNRVGRIRNALNAAKRVRDQILVELALNPKDRNDDVAWPTNQLDPKHVPVEPIESELAEMPSTFADQIEPMIDEFVAKGRADVESTDLLYNFNILVANPMTKHKLENIVPPIIGAIKNQDMYTFLPPIIGPMRIATLCPLCCEHSTRLLVFAKHSNHLFAACIHCFCTLITSVARDPTYHTTTFIKRLDAVKTGPILICPTTGELLSNEYVENRLKQKTVDDDGDDILNFDCSDDDEYDDLTTDGKLVYENDCVVINMAKFEYVEKQRYRNLASNLIELIVDGIKKDSSIATNQFKISKTMKLVRLEKKQIPGECK